MLNLSKSNSFLEKLKSSLGNKGFVIVIVGVLAGLMLLLIPTEESTNRESVNSESTPSVEYCEMLENKAEALIKELPEVDGCRVFLTLESGYRYIYATDQHVREGEKTKETDKTIVLAGNGNGESPILIEESMPKIAGVAVVCPKASYETQYRIVELMCALFDIDSHRISVQT